MFNRSYIRSHLGHPHYIPDGIVKNLKDGSNLNKDEEELIRIIKHLSDPTKFKIYLLLHKVESMPVTDITLILGLTQSGVSHALSDLKDAGLIKAYRCGQLICYSLVDKFKENKSRFYINKILKLAN
ncbi:MAG: winged helix-turn-helix transcriptional regulator [Candidatus Levybacteria bacterium]|nr:winged helix-turn-helix transcriptional regulator [Candidatus Levybacteria bacterium]